MAKPTWYPDNDDEIIEKCNRENNVTPEMEKEYRIFKDTPTVHAIALCRAKGLNIYDDETGLNVERMTEIFFTNNTECRKALVQQCVDKTINIISKGEMVYKTFNCIAEEDVDKKTIC